VRGQVSKVLPQIPPASLSVFAWGWYLALARGRLFALGYQCQTSSSISATEESVALSVKRALPFLCDHRCSGARRCPKMLFSESANLSVELALRSSRSARGWTTRQSCLGPSERMAKASSPPRRPAGNQCDIS